MGSMAVKYIEVDGLGKVRLFKRRGTRNIRVTLTLQGEIRVSLPSWAPYKLGVQFVNNKRDWIIANKSQPRPLQPGQQIGKAHRLDFVPQPKNNRVHCRLTGNAVRVHYPAVLSTGDNQVQNAARRGALKALHQEAVALLPSRLQDLAAKYGFTYSKLRIRHLRSKWGSCDNHQVITLNTFLMTLPWDLIDYVLLHELVHTKVLRHGLPFWEEMNRHLPHVREARKRLRGFLPSFGDTVRAPL